MIMTIITRPIKRIAHLPVLLTAVLVVVAALVVTAGPARATAPTPSWWSGNCDVNNHPGSQPLGASYNGVEACGPGPLQGGHDYPVKIDGFGEYEWECVELVMRYMYLMYGIAPYSANGNTVVSNYPGSLLTKVPNNGSSLPGPGDIISEGATATNTYGHTAVVTNVSVSNGTGTVTIMQQNVSSSRNGWGTISVSNNVLGSGVTGWLHAPASAIPGGSGPVVRAVATSDGHVQLFDVSNGTIYQNWYSPIDGSIGGGSSAPPMANGAQAAGNPAVVPRPGQQVIDLFVRSTAGQILETWYNWGNGSWGGWIPVSGATVTGDPQAVATSDGHDQVFVDADGVIEQNWFSPATGAIGDGCGSSGGRV
jgi:CHAP domain